jgi:hypothetical protein
MGRQMDELIRVELGNLQFLQVNDFSQLWLCLMLKTSLEICVVVDYLTKSTYTFQNICKNVSNLEFQNQ